MRFSDMYLAMATDEREAFARKVGSEAGYLWQLATRWRGKKASIEFIKKLAEADSRLTVGGLVAEFTEDAPTTEADKAVG